jgi:hypothetical protein
VIGETIVDDGIPDGSILEGPLAEGPVVEGEVVEGPMVEGPPSMPPHCASYDGHGHCVNEYNPLHEPCYPHEAHGFVGRFIGMMYEYLCCPDPFYEMSGPHWVPAANAAFFVEHARPRSQTRLRWDSGQNLLLPDRNDFFWSGPPLGPIPVNPVQGIPSTNYDELTMYIEAAPKNGKFSVFFNTPYRAVDPINGFRYGGFGDLDAGVKTLLFDCELFQLGMQMRTYIPTGVGLKGEGTEHTTIEPSLLLAIQLMKDCYLENQVAEWIPIGGTEYASGVLHFHHSFNKVIWKLNPDVQLIWTAEVNGWAFQGGEYTDPLTLLPVSSSGGRYASVGSGLRLSYCDKIDFGFGAAQAVTNPHWADQLYRLEMRLMY